MATWLHFVGKQYYSKAKFKKEAEKHGVSRRISLQMLKKMSWGDRILLAQLDGKTPVIFGEFYVDRIIGFSPEVMEKIQQSHSCKINDLGGYMVSRECGDFMAGVSYVVDASIAELVDCAKDAEDAGKPMVAGIFIERPLVRLKQIPFRQGFRAFDYQAFMEAYKVAETRSNGKIPVVYGQFYDYEQLPSLPGTGEIQEVKNYRKK